MCEIVFSINSSGKYFLHLGCKEEGLVFIETTSSVKTERFCVLLGKGRSLFFLRSHVGNISLKIYSSSVISGQLIRRRGLRAWPLRTVQLFDKFFSDEALGRINLNLETLSIRQISMFSPKAHLSGRLDHGILKGVELTDKSQSYENLHEFAHICMTTESFSHDFAKTYDQCNDDDLIFMLDARGMTTAERLILLLWVKQIAGEPFAASAARDLFRNNPAIGAIVGGGTEFGDHPKWVNSGRLEKHLSALGITRDDVIKEGGTRPFMVIRKSSLVALKALNFSYADLGSGLLEPALFEWSLLPLISSSGSLIVAPPKPKSYILEYKNLDHAQFVEFRKIAEAAGNRVCLFVGLLNREGKFTPHAYEYMRLLRAEGLLVFALGVVRGDIAAAVDPGPEFCDGFAARENSGYDFAIWATALNRYPELWQAKSLLLANDSVFVAKRALKFVIDELEGSAYDVTGLSASEMENFHLQSYFIHLKKTALDNEVVRNFWRQIVAWKDKFRIISAYEVAMTGKFQSAGLSCGSLFDPQRKFGSNRINPSIHYWKEILEAGYPFVKLQLLRDNPTSENLNEWKQMLEKYQFDTNAIIDEFLEEAPSAVILRGDRKGA